MKGFLISQFLQNAAQTKHIAHSTVIKWMNYQINMNVLETLATLLQSLRQ